MCTVMLLEIPTCVLIHHRKQSPTNEREKKLRICQRPLKIFVSGRSQCSDLGPTDNLVKVLRDVLCLFLGFVDTLSSTYLWVHTTLVQIKQKHCHRKHSTATLFLHDFLKIFDTHLSMILHIHVCMCKKYSNIQNWANIFYVCMLKAQSKIKKCFKHFICEFHGSATSITPCKILGKFTVVQSSVIKCFHAVNFRQSYKPRTKPRSDSPHFQWFLL